MEFPSSDFLLYGDSPRKPRITVGSREKRPHEFVENARELSAFRRPAHRADTRCLKKELQNGAKLEIYYNNSTINRTLNYIFEIYEMKGDSVYLALEDYKTARQNQEIIGIVVGPIFLLLEIITLFMIIKNRGLPTD